MRVCLSISSGLNCLLFNKINNSSNGVADHGAFASLSFAFFFFRACVRATILTYLRSDSVCLFALIYS